LKESTSLKVIPMARHSAADFSPKEPIGGAWWSRTASRRGDVTPMRSEIDAIGPRWQRLYPVSDRTRIESEGMEA